jgi:cytidine deaminase
MITSNNFSDLIAEAQRLVRPVTLARPSEDAGTVGCALQAQDGQIHTGICIDLACGIGFCAEAAAIVNMIKEGETVIDYIVAVSKRGILPPCGRCREMIVQVSEQNYKTLVIVSATEAVPMSELLPRHWLNVKS